MIRSRPYQTKAIEAALAKSGILQMPCGAGKTYTAIQILMRLRKPTVVVCLNTVTVHQWIAEVRKYTNFNERFLCRRTGQHKDRVPTSGFYLLFTTYAMAWKDPHPCGLLILDEVHVAPADKFRTILESCPAPHRLGLTATLVREDDKITDLFKLIGPVLTTVDCRSLVQAGYLASVSYRRVPCPFPAVWEKRYNAASGAERLKLCARNPSKIPTLKDLVAKHEALGDKILVFGDTIELVRSYAVDLGRPFLDGGVGNDERERVFTAFHTTKVVNTLFLSRIGDCAIDLPSANVVIQFDSQGGARRQEGQRMGRIMRPGHVGTFYTLVTPNTREHEFSEKREQYLIELGFIF